MKEVFLIVVLWFNGGGRMVNVHPMPSWDVCLQATASAIVNVSNGNESEAMAVAYCAYGKP